MRAFTGTCSSSSLVFRTKNLGGNGDSPVHYSGLRPVENKQMASNWSKQSALLNARNRRSKPIRAMAASAPKRKKDPKKRVVITGMGLVSMFGNDIDTFYDKLLAGQSGITLIDRFDASSFSVRFAGQIRDFSSKSR